MSDSLVNVCFNNSIGSKFKYMIIKIVVILVSAEDTCHHRDMLGCFTFNNIFLALVAAILDKWKLVLSVTLRRQTQQRHMKQYNVTERK